MMKLFLKNSNLCDRNSPTSQTDRQTDRQTTCDRNTALCTKVHRAVKMEWNGDANFQILGAEGGNFQVSLTKPYNECACHQNASFKPLTAFITGCAVAQHCCNDDQQSQWEIEDYDPL